MEQSKVTKRGKRGVALLMVIVALTMLLLMAVCFVISMQAEKRLTQGAINRTRARSSARGALDYSIAQLGKTCEMKERYAAQEPLYKTPDYDCPREYQVAITLPGIDVDAPCGEIWSARIEDEQGKVNVNSATPWLLGNLMGSAIVVNSAYSTDTEIVVDTTEGFPERGHLWVNGEIIEYRGTAGDRFLNCTRACRRECYGGTSDTPQSINAGTSVIDARAYYLCRYRVGARPGHFTPFRTVDEIRRIADQTDEVLTTRLFSRLEPFLTVHSGRDVEWIHPQKIQNDLPGGDTASVDAFYLDDVSLYRPGMTVRISEGNNREHAMILAIQEDRVVLDGKVGRSFTAGNAIAEVLQPHPINVNSAHPKVLHALFKGLTAGGNWIDSREANFVVNEILEWREKKGAVQSTADFKDLLTELQKRLRDGKILDQSGREALTDTELEVLLSAARSISGCRKRFGGIVTAAYNDGYRPVFPPLASLAFRNHDTYMIEACAVVNSSNGIPIAQETIRQIVTVTPAPSPEFPEKFLQWDISSQNDFEHYLAHLPSFRVVSWPRPVRHFTVFPAHDPAEPGTGLSPDNVSITANLFQGAIWQIQYPWSQTHEGVEMPESDAPHLPARCCGSETAPGCLWFWFYPLSKPPLYIFDWGEKEWENRVRCAYENGKFVLQVADSTVEQSVCEIIAPVKLEPQWYHIIAAWHSTEPGGLALWIDGVPRGEFGYRGVTQYCSALSKDIKQDSAYVPLTNTDHLPAQGVVRIGDEAIEYSEILGGILVVRRKYQGFEPEILGRGARGTTAAAHPQGAGVYPFGYSDPLVGHICRGAKLTHDVALENAHTTLTSKVSQKDTTITVGDTSEFQASGFALITSGGTREKIRYEKGGKSTLVNCRRGQLSTAASDFKEAYVIPISVMVDDNREFPDSGMFQIENEWFAYESKIDHRYFLFYLGDSEIQELQGQNKLSPLYRGACGTMGAEHAFGKAVLPVFETRYGWEGRGDMVTVIDQNDSDAKEEMEVNWVHRNFVAFTGDVSRTYRPGGGTRLLKFPSGELPIKLAGNPVWGRDKFRNLSSPLRLDEVLWSQTSARRRYFLSAALPPDREDASINDTMDFPHDGGLFKVGDEYLGYCGLNQGQPTGVQREFAATPARPYTGGTPLFPVFFLPVSVLRIPLAERAARIPVADPSDFPGEGYVKCGHEIISYTKKERSDLMMPAGKLDQGIFRGSFGSRARPHPTGAIVHYFPTRYWDRVAVDYDGRELAYFEAAKTAPGAFWSSITADADFPSGDHLGMEIRVRVDGRPQWDEIPDRFRFEDPRGPNLIDVAGDTLEVRIYFTYKDGAYPGSHWKTKALLKSLRVKYRQPVRVWESRSGG